MIRLTACAGILALCLSGCATVSSTDPMRFDKAPLFGMIYDYDNRECSGVTIVTDGTQTSTSDINGRFVLADLTPGVHSLSAKKADYEPLQVTFEFASLTQVLYLKMFSFGELLEKAQQALDQGHWLDARSFLDRAAALNAKDTVLGYLEAVLYYKQKDYAKAAWRLELLVEIGEADPSIYLFLADLYQYSLNNPEAARKALTECLRVAANSDVERRLKALSEQKPD